MARRTWDKRTIIKEIRDWHRRGRYLCHVRVEYPALQAAAERHFGTWSQAVRAAGYTPGPRAPRKWTPQRVIEEIKARYTADISLPELRRRNPGLASAAQRRFGSWARAVRGRFEVPGPQTMELGEGMNSLPITYERRHTNAASRAIRGVNRRRAQPEIRDSRGRRG